ncbi:MAG: glycosyltransferase family 2 protein [Thermoflexibacter sp.]|jgi:dolichol-phosphate mannosyltransferase|nr:glycosyltransferase family 2 protein [Thermoflexibacter sp.]
MLYSFVVPIYNDGYLAEDFCVEYQKVFQEYTKLGDISNEVELIFVNDGSKNNALEELQTVSQKFNFVKVIDLSRNFGQHIALSCGYYHARGSYVGMLNVDMQDPPNQIPLLLEEMKEKDYDMVFGLREKRFSSWGDKISSYAFNILLNKLTGGNSPVNVSTLRVMNRRFIDAYNSLQEKSRYLPGLESWLGFKQGYVPTKHQARQKGKSSYNFKKRMLMALDAIVSFSDIPLKIISLVGIGIALIGFILALIIVVTKLFFVDYQHGFVSMISAIIFVGGIQIIVIGLAGIYIGRVLKEVQNRPLYIIREKINFK